jgi:hypothetical protein
MSRVKGGVTYCYPSRFIAFPAPEGIGSIPFFYSVEQRRTELRQQYHSYSVLLLTSLYLLYTPTLLTVHIYCTIPSIKQLLPRTFSYSWERPSHFLIHFLNSLFARLTHRPISNINGVLDYLNWVLNIPIDLRSPIQLFHLSFHDFLVDREQSGPEFFVDKQSAHARIAANCIQIMSAGTSGLQEDICGLQYPGTPKCDVSADTVKDRIPAELQYACRYWVEHLKRGKVKVEDNDSVHAFLKEHMLHWLEVSRLLGTISEALYMATTLRY